jgi:Protein of unknown function (DUF1573)
MENKMTRTAKIASAITLWMTISVVGAVADRLDQSATLPSAPETAASLGKAPKAVFPEVIYRFSPVFEGTTIEHDFVVTNQGQAPLVISNVRPDCGCSVASNPGQVAPGGREVISVAVRTGHRSGGTLLKGFTVYTNNRDNAQVRLAVAGEVKAYFTVSPGYVRMVGPANRHLRAVVRITPSQYRPLVIRKVEVQEDRYLRCELKPQGAHPETEGYELVVENTLQKPGSYRVLITVRTDIKEKPSFTIPVYGLIQNASE